MSIRPIWLAILITLGTAACLDPEPTTATAEADLSTKGPPARFCDEAFDCNNGCACITGTCQPDGFGPPAPAGFCAIAPVRACDDANDCRDACACVGGTCRPTGFSPQPPPDYCALPPPDQYEFNDTVTAGTSYMGAPQVHTFWDRFADQEDWIWVYFGVAGTFTFDTADSRGTYMELYRFTGTWPPTPASFTFVAANDDKCGIWYSPYCWGSRITTPIAADSLYAARVINQAVGTMNAYEPDPPQYTFAVW